ncbi:MAG TPA: LLM class F420-dependent oxidoreductase [Acidimicrobiales bacterium]|jgi:probable F420-dependent oxidoreductase|nr:LLM class F420-dependent oxidoreductase [Acidimicrobiales bacterium]
MDIGRVGIWTGVLDAVPSAEAQRIAGRLEAMGFPTLWIPETIGRDPFVTATLLLCATSTLKIATGIANIYARDAVTMANTQRSLEEAFPGRFLLGLGVSHHHLVDRVRHHNYSKPYSYMAHYLDDMNGALFLAVGPAERPPTVLAALGPKMLRLSAERAAGAHPYFVPVEHTAQAREILGPDPILAPEQMVVLETDRAKALAIARAGMAVYLRAPNYVNNLKRHGFTDDDVADGGSERLVDAIVATGDVSAAVDRVQQHFDAGASHVCVQVLGEHFTDVPEGAWRDLAAALPLGG